MDLVKAMKPSSIEDFERDTRGKGQNLCSLPVP